MYEYIFALRKATFARPAPGIYLMRQSSALRSCARGPMHASCL